MLYNKTNPHGGDVYGERVEFDFSANTNPFGTPQGVIRAIEASFSSLFRYPDPYCRTLVAKIAEFEGVKSEYVLCGNGAAELIYSFAEAVKAESALLLAPTFLEYSLALKKFGCKMLEYRLDAGRDFELDYGILNFINKHKPSVVIICNPNNPTGRTVDAKLMESILEICSRIGSRLFVDECFLSLSDSGTSLVRRLSQNKGLFILKAFTKSYGMAGLRLGYCLSSDATLLEKMSESVQPWNVSTPAQAAGVAALDEREFILKTRALVQEQREYLASELSRLGLRVFESHANYLLFKGPCQLFEELKKMGIAIRDCSNYIGLDKGYYRIAVRLPDENRVLISAIKDILKNA